ncbi:hypothetical protein VaNZ11_016954 [Volvox africanus]|uniref:Uncharacterized protein n=1 Tax=Volvox africanus TaxID=51714 RepID=A0ABQ5SNT8_9CHLO|nr:hypothetical protein VaNZ11_016954 [Volvox africanus]
MLLTNTRVALANSGNETTLNCIPSMGIANEPVNVFAAVPPVPATQTPSRRTRDGQAILPIAEQSPSTTHSAAELPLDVVGYDAMEASDGEPPAKRVRAYAPQAAAAAVGTGPSSASRPHQRDKRPSSGGRGNTRGILLYFFYSEYPRTPKEPHHGKATGSTLYFDG